MHMETKEFLGNLLNCLWKTNNEHPSFQQNKGIVIQHSRSFVKISQLLTIVTRVVT